MSPASVYIAGKILRASRPARPSTTSALGAAHVGKFPVVDRVSYYVGSIGRRELPVEVAEQFCGT